MIATPTSIETGHYKLTKRPTIGPDRPLQSCHLATLCEHPVKSHVDRGDSTIQNHQIIDRSSKRLAEAGFFAIEHVKSYLIDMHRRACRPGTLKMAFDSIYPFLCFLKARGRTCIDSIIREDLSAFIEHEQDRGMQPRTVSGRLRSLYAFIGYLAERNLVNPNLLKKKYRIKEPDTLPRAIDPLDMRKVLSVIDHVRNRAMVLVLLRTGMRIGELLGLTEDDLNLAEQRIEIFEARKTRTGRVVYLSDDAQAALLAWLNCRCADKPLIFYAQGRSTMCYESARNMFNKYLDKAGISHKGYTLHCLRHTFASELLNAGMRLECVQQLLGHSCIEMTRRYARLTDNTRKEEYFRAMAIIEKGGINGYYRIDSELAQALETPELLSAHD